MAEYFIFANDTLGSRKPWISIGGATKEALLACLGVGRMKQEVIIGIQSALVAFPVSLWPKAEPFPKR